MDSECNKIVELLGDSNNSEDEIGLRRNKEKKKSGVSIELPGTDVWSDH